MSLDAVRSDVREHGGHVEVALEGELSLRTVPDVRALLGKLLLDSGHVLVDVSRLRVNWPAAVDVFPATLSHAGGWPSARLVLFGADRPTADVLHAAAVPASVPLAAGLDEAEALLHRRPERLTRRSDLPRTPGAQRWARAVVGMACQDWFLDEVADDAALVATELVTNAVEHARTSSVLTVGLDRSGLHIRVRDWGWPRGASPRSATGRSRAPRPRAVRRRPVEPQLGGRPT